MAVVKVVVVRVVTWRGRLASWTASWRDDVLEREEPEEEVVGLRGGRGERGI